MTVVIGGVKSAFKRPLTQRLPPGRGPASLGEPKTGTMVVGHEQTGDQAPLTKDLPREIALQVGPSADATVRGRAGIKRLLTRQLRRARTLHQVWEPELTPESSGCVRVVWKMRDRVETPLYVLEGEGFYEDRYVQSDDAWKIASVRLHRNKVELRPKSLIMRAILWMHVNGWLAPGERP